MRLVLPLLFAAFFLAVVFVAFKPDQASNPSNAAFKFVKHIQNNDYRKAVDSFGGNICRCPAKLGWVSYMFYASGEEPNLAFMMGKNFDFGPVSFKRMKVETKTTSVLDKPEDFEVSIPLRFEARRYQPLFIPMDMAYGYDITREKFDDFLKDPDKESWKALTLRMRPSLAAGVTTQPAASKNLVSKHRPDAAIDGLDANGVSQTGLKRSPVSGDGEGNVDQSKLEKELFGDEAARYITPKDAANVTFIEDGANKIMPAAEVEKQLPRLKTALLRLHMVRKDQRQPFTVFHFVVSDPVLIVPARAGVAEHEVALKNFKPPLGK